MSKVWKKPISIPKGVTIQLQNNTVTVQGPKGTLSYTLLEGISIDVQEDVATVSVNSEEIKNLWWLTRALVTNMVEGVTQWYEKKLLIIGVGYGAKVEGKNLNLSIGLSHKVNFPIPQGIEMKTEQDAKNNTIVILWGIDKQLVGETAAKIRSLRKPEPYKGKGIRYFDEVIKLKAGKAAKK